MKTIIVAILIDDELTHRFGAPWKIDVSKLLLPCFSRGALKQFEMGNRSLVVERLIRGFECIVVKVIVWILLFNLS